MGDVLTVTVSAFVGAVVAAIGVLVQNALTMRSKVDEGLRASRLEVYKVLWKKTELLPMWPRATAVTYRDLADLSEAFRDWYFTEGGLFLSSQSRTVYGELQESL
jgi:hypothetical protein